MDSAIAQKTRNAVGRYASESSPIVVFVIIALLVMVGIICFIIYRVRRADLQSTRVIKEPRKMGTGTKQLVVDANKMPVTLSGQEYSFSFWMYLTSVTPTDAPKFVFMRGGSTANVGGASCIVYMDRAVNKLTVAVKTNANITPDLDLTGIDGINNSITVAGSNAFLKAAIDYLPMMRWVNVTFVVQDNLLSLYMDGDLYTVQNANDLKDRPILKGVAGDLRLGGIGAGISQGYVAKMDFYNYALMQRDVQHLYKSGPHAGTLLGVLGFDDYGLRAPVYRLD